MRRGEKKSLQCIADLQRSAMMNRLNPSTSTLTPLSWVCVTLLLCLSTRCCADAPAPGTSTSPPVTPPITIKPPDEPTSSFEDTRCKCVCDKMWDAEGKETKVVYINITDSCDCEHVVKPNNKNIPCARCVCRTETRNTTTIKVMVILIICVISLLFVYMLFLLCLEPLMQRRPTSYQQHTNEEEDMSSGPRTEEATTPTALAPPGPSPQAMSARQRSLLNRVSTEQKKWKGTVQEQRKNIYDRHSMLN